MASPFITVRYPDEAWELALREDVPNVGDILRRSDGKREVVTAAEDRSGHIIVTWRRTATPEVSDE